MTLPTTGPRGLGGAGSLPITHTDSSCWGHHQQQCHLYRVTHRARILQLSKKGLSLEKGLIQLAGSCVTLSKTLYLSEHYSAVCKTETLSTACGRGQTWAGACQDPCTERGSPASASPPGPLHLLFSGHRCAAHAQPRSGCHHHAPGTDELLLMGFFRVVARGGGLEELQLLTHPSEILTQTQILRESAKKQKCCE